MPWGPARQGGAHSQWQNRNVADEPRPYGQGPNRGPVTPAKSCGNPGRQRHPQPSCLYRRRTRPHHTIAPVTNIAAGANPKNAQTAFVA